MRLSAVFDDADRLGEDLLAIRFAVDYAMNLWGVEASLTRAARRLDVTGYQLRRSAVDVEATFAIRRFVQFEAVLRDFWSQGMGRRTRPDMRPLMDAVARRRQMNGEDLAAAHGVRAYRNALVHGAGPHVDELDFEDCQQRLARYLRWLPRQW